MKRKASKRKVKSKQEWRAECKDLAHECECLEDELERQRIAFQGERERQTIAFQGECEKQIKHVRMIAEVTRDVIGFLRKVDRPNIEASEAESSARQALNLIGRFVAKWGSGTGVSSARHR